MADGLKLGAFYSTFEEANSIITEFCKRHNHPVRLYSKETFESKNKRLGDQSKITWMSPETPYSFRWVCKCHKLNVHSLGKSSRYRSNCINCPVCIFVYYDRQERKYKITKLNLNHNHKMDNNQQIQQQVNGKQQQELSIIKKRPTRRFDFQASLQRLSRLCSNIDKMRQQAAEEVELLSELSVTLPSVVTLDRSRIVPHKPSVALLRDHCHGPWTFQYIPIDVSDDGNCLFRAVSTALYATEAHYDMLRLLTVIEVLLNPDMYDTDSTEYYPAFKADPCLVVASYKTLVAELATDGAHCDMLAVLAVSAVVHRPIQTVWPIMSTPDAASPMTKLVMGRGVQTDDTEDSDTVLYLLWTSASYTRRSKEKPSINHFAPLVKTDGSNNGKPDVGGNVAGSDGVDLKRNDSEASEKISEDEGEKLTSLVSNAVSETLQTATTLKPVAATSTTAAGGIELGEPLTIHQCIDFINNADIDTLPTCIPVGPKNNIYFVINNKMNVERHAAGHYRSFTDDCGTWGDQHALTKYRLLPSLRTVEFVDGAFGCYKRIDCLNVFVPLDVQPAPDEVIGIVRWYARCKSDKTLMKRVTWIEKGRHVAVVEYLRTAGTETNDTRIRTKVPLSGPNGKKVAGKTQSTVNTRLSDVVVGRPGNRSNGAVHSNGVGIVVGAGRGTSSVGSSTPGDVGAGSLPRRRGRPPSANKTTTLTSPVVSNSSHLSSTPRGRVSLPDARTSQQVSQSDVKTEPVNSLSRTPLVDSRSRPQPVPTPVSPSKPTGSPSIPPTIASPLSAEYRLLTSLVETHEFVQCVSFVRGQGPVAYLYTPDQITDLRRLCCTGATSSLYTALRVTCALPTHLATGYLLTVTAFTNKTLQHVSNATKSSLTNGPSTDRSLTDAPLFIGPMMLHKSNSFETYHAFFSHVTGALESHIAATELSLCDDVPDGLIEEHAVVKAVYRAFYTAKHAFCLRHCESVVRQQMSLMDVDALLHDTVISLLFSADRGISTSHDESTMNVRLAQLQEVLWDSDINFTNYLNQNILPQIVTNLELMWGEEQMIGCSNDSSCQSVSDILQLSRCASTVTDGRSTVELVDQLFDCVRSQYADIVQAMFGYGEYRLSASLAHHHVPYSRWSRLAERKQAQLFTAFMLDTGSTIDGDGTAHLQDGELQAAAIHGETPLQDRGKHCTATAAVSPDVDMKDALALLDGCSPTDSMDDSANSGRLARKRRKPTRYEDE